MRIISKISCLKRALEGPWQLWQVQGGRADKGGCYVCRSFTNGIKADKNLLCVYVPGILKKAKVSEKKYSFLLQQTALTKALIPNFGTSLPNRQIYTYSLWAFSGLCILTIHRQHLKTCWNGDNLPWHCHLPLLSASQNSLEMRTLSSLGVSPGTGDEVHRNCGGFFIWKNQNSELEKKCYCYRKKW